MLLIVLVALGYAAWKFGLPLLNGEAATAPFFGGKTERRLEVVAQANVDGRRRLVMIRRDDVEHLIMTGGPVDVVIETGIGEKKTKANGVSEPPKAVFSRQARTLGQVTPSES